MTTKTHGFTIVETRKVSEIDATVTIYRHDLSGARLMYIDADDDNKVFSIAFRTPPTDSTGVAHIMEHAVLCGSEKYPSKEPFNELAKGSLATFLNAFTSSDFTSYPVGSMNDKDFRILMEVYLDAVFFPNIAKIDEIFFQEGWHYEMESPDDDLSINGIVFNEMKGAYSEPHSIMQFYMSQALGPDSSYRHDSGGFPANIPDLTLDAFRDFHKKYYHPANSYIALYGRMDINEILQIIDSQALCRFTARDIDTPIITQQPYSSPITAQCQYPISPTESTKDKTWFALEFLIDLDDNPADSFSFEIIAHLLLGTPAAPLKNAFLQAGIAKDVYGHYSKSVKQPSFEIVLKDSDPVHSDAVKKIFFDTLRQLCEGGIDKELIEASINIREFGLREADMGYYPKGFVYMYYSVGAWLRDKDPISALCYEENLKHTKKSLTSRYYESLIQKYLIDNNHYVFMTMSPVPGLAEKKHAEEEVALAEIKKSLTTSQIEGIISTTEKIKERQETPDSPEDIEKIPTLRISDVSPTAQDFSLKDTTAAGITYLDHATFTNDIVYLKLYFDTSSLPQELLPYASTLAYLLQKISTKKYHYTQLANQINIHTGGFRIGLQCTTDYTDLDIYKPLFSISGKALLPKTEKMVELLTEITNDTIFDDDIRLLELLNEVKSTLEMELLGESVTYADRRLKSYFCESGKFDEVIHGYEYYLFIQDILKNFETTKATFIEKLTKTYQAVFTKNALYISITSPEKDLHHVKNALSPWIDTLRHTDAKSVKYHFDSQTTNEAFVLPGNVQYVAKGFSFRKLGYEYNGDMEVMDNILSSDYLWNKIRVQGGAYGAWLSLLPNGLFTAISYRDPHIENTLGVYDTLAKYLSEVDISPRELEKYIIGTVGKYDTPKTPSIKSAMSDLNYFRGRTQEDLQMQRDQMLSADISKVKAYHKMIDDIMRQNIYCVFGTDAKIKANTQLFGKVINVVV
jgi:hypothetical protein